MCAERNEFWPYAIIEYRVERRENIWWHLHWNIENKQMIMGFCFDRKVTKWTESIPFRLIAWNCTLFQLCVYVEFRLVFWFRRVDSLGEIESRSTHTHTHAHELTEWEKWRYIQRMHLELSFLADFNSAAIFSHLKFQRFHYTLTRAISIWCVWTTYKMNKLARERERERAHQEKRAETRRNVGKSKEQTSQWNDRVRWEAKIKERDQIKISKLNEVEIYFTSRSRPAITALQKST